MNLLSLWKKFLIFLPTKLLLKKWVAEIKKNIFYTINTRGHIIARQFKIYIGSIIRHLVLLLNLIALKFTSRARQEGWRKSQKYLVELLCII